MTAGMLLYVAMLGAVLGVWAGYAAAYRVGRWFWSPRRVQVGRAVAYRNARRWT